ncbi:MAG: ribosomal L7Ae/L30e/S12e/Gadd45 family protein [Ruminiclostridium sp.]|jgi:ribosomal protein L30E|nr:ribosomal L7Ae/L30e/S12e/Gadd45 family protein [Ruminiclostridium sp.]
MSKTLSTIGLCRRAGKLIYGFDAVVEAVKPPDSKVSGVLVTSDLSEKTKKEIRYECGKAEVPVTELPETLDDIKQVIGKRTGVLAVLDDGLYKSVVGSIL